MAESQSLVRSTDLAYSNDVKESALGVPGALLAAHGAVSSEVASEMAMGARAALGATYALAVTGIAGPTGGTPDKPVGTVWMALAGPEGEVTRLGKFRGDRGMIRTSAAYGALQLLREALDEGLAQP